MTETLFLRLIDKDQSTPTGTSDLPASRTGTIDGDLVPLKASVEFIHTAVKKTASVLVKIPIQADGLFIRTGPLLMDENTKNNYLIEHKITQGVNEGKFFRGEIGIPTIIEDENLGEILSIPCEGIQRISKEHFDSVRGPLTTRNNILQDPQERFINTITTYEKSRGSNGTIIGFQGGNADTAIDLPKGGALRQQWEMFGPKKTQRLLLDVLERLEQAPQLGGTLLDFYWDYEPSLTVTRKIDIFAEEFGKQSSGVVIDPLTVDDGGETEKRVNTDNLAYKNLIIAKCDPFSGSVPPEHQRFRSQYLHATARDIWDPAVTYNKGDVVKRQFPGSFPDERFFTLLSTTDTGSTPENFGLIWAEDFSIDPASPVFFSPTPWTASLDDFRANMVGKGNPGIAGYEGFFFDWNIARTLYDRDLSQDPYQRLSVKEVKKRSNTPPLKSETYDGYRVVIGVLGSNDGDILGGAELFNKDPSGNNVWIGANRGKIAEYFGSVISHGFGSGWKITDAPTDTGSGSDRLQDTINDLETAKVLKWDKNANGGSGDWIDAWDVSANNDKSSPFHIVKSTQLVDSATGIPNQAFEARFDFKDSVLPPPFGYPDRDAKNRTSRGAWLSFIHPYPHITTGSGVGALCGADDGFPFFDAFNLDRTCDGSVGWNHGLKSEELGKVNGIHFKLKVGFYTSTDDSARTLGIANMPMTLWAMDKFGRVYFQDFTHRVNTEWDDYTISFGPDSPQQYFFSRFDEVAELLGYKLPFNFNLREREYTGVQFDWRFVKFWGIFSKHMYSEDTGHYTGFFNQVYKSFIEVAEQIGHKLIQIGELIYNGETNVPLTDDFITDHATIAIDELYYVKELYTSSNDSEVSDPRVEMIDMRAERDYLTGKAKAIATKARKEFFPQFWHMRAKGDVRMKLGQRFIASGARVPGGSVELVCAEVKHIWNDDGYFMEIFGIRKFVA